MGGEAVMDTTREAVAQLEMQVESLMERIARMDTRYRPSRPRGLTAPISRESIEQAYGAQVATAITATAELFDVTLDDLMRGGRPAQVADARHVAMAVVHRLPLKCSSVRIGRMFHRDHTSVLHAIRKVNRSERLMLMVARVEEAI